MSPIIFLDCDGVINNWNSVHRSGYVRSLYVAEPELVKILQKFCEDEDAIVVLSSTWRITISKSELVQVIGSWLMHHLPSGSAWKTGRDSRGFRGNEVVQWFNENPIFKKHKYVIFDDDSDFHSDQPLVNINGEFGLTENDIEIAKSLLR